MMQLAHLEDGRGILVCGMELREEVADGRQHSLMEGAEFTELCELFGCLERNGARHNRTHAAEADSPPCSSKVLIESSWRRNVEEEERTLFEGANSRRGKKKGKGRGPKRVRRK
jgi:hypothetical protein